MVWKLCILVDLRNFGFRGHLPVFIWNFLFECSFKVRVGSVKAVQAGDGGSARWHPDPSPIQHQG